MNGLARLAVVLSAALGVAGCASTPNQNSGTPNLSFPHPLAKVRQAAIDALVVCGFEIKKQEAAYVEGRRPHKAGLFVGSGGETVGVWLEAAAPERTNVTIATAKSFVGVVGQKNWDAQVTAEMEKGLAR